MLTLKKHDNKNLINYFLETLEILKMSMLDKKNLKKFVNLMIIKNIPEEQKVNAAPQIPINIVAPLQIYRAPIIAPQGIKVSSFLKM